MAKNNLTMNRVKKQYRKVQEKVDYELKDGLNISYYQTFPQSRIKKLLDEMSLNLKYADEKGITINEENMFNYALFMCIKHFTSLKSDISDKFEEQILQMEWLVDTGYFEEIENDVLPQDQVKRVLDSAIKLSSKFMFFEKLTQQMQDEMGKLELQNADILSQLGNKIVQ